MTGKGNKLLRRGLPRILAGSCLLLAAAWSQAQDPPSFPGQNASQPGSSQSSSQNTDALSLLLDQNNALRAELQALRAIVEEQGFDLRRLRRDSLSRYTNMDERLQALENGQNGQSAPAPDGPTSTSSTAPASSPAANATARAPIDLPTRAPAQAAETEAAPASPAISSVPIATAPRNTESATNTSSAPIRNRGSSLQPAVLSEQQLYQMAYESAINANFERSIAEFEQYLSVYPNGRFVDNAHYWKGQSYLYLNRYEEARESYEIILDGYGDSAKLPDAMYGLGQAYQGLGDTRRARELFNSIKRRFPNTGVANLADTRLLSLD